MTRMVVPPLRKRDGELTGCTGATMAQSGRVYRASRSGHFEVENPSDVGWMLRTDNVMESKFSVPDAKAATCEGCDFHGFSWQKICPRCEGRMVKEGSS